MTTFRLRRSAPHIRRGRVAKQARRERALGRWIENRARGYRTSEDRPSGSHYVDGQIDILLRRV